MKIILERMVIDHFKGIDHLELQVAPEGVTRISGRNGAGKTSIADAYTWVFLNKDSAGNAPGTDDFREKPLDESGNEIHQLDTSVELYCTLDGQPFNVKRVQSENWVKARGKSEAKYQGNVSKYFINEVPVKAGELQARLGSICREDIFRYLTMLSAFNAAPWADRRRILLEMANVDIDSALLSSPQFDRLAHECATRGVGIDELKKVLQASLREMNSQIKLMPSRIDEATRALPQVDPSAAARAAEELPQFKTELERLEEEISIAGKDTDAAIRARTVLALKTELVSIQNAIQAEHDSRQKEVTGRLNAAMTRLNVERTSLTQHQQTLELGRREMAFNEHCLEELRGDYRKAFSETCVLPTDIDVCPTCGQPTPAEYRDRIREEAQGRFNEQKQKRLTEIKAEAERYKTRTKQLGSSIVAAEKAIDDHAKQIKDLEADVAALQQEMVTLPPMPDFQSEPRCAELLAKINELQAAGTDAAPDTTVADLKGQREQVLEKIRMANEVLAKRDVGRGTELRIAELRQEQRDLGDRIAEMEQTIMLCEDFTRERCARLEDSVSSLFPTVQWKLFNQQINGGLADCCMCMVQGEGCMVPYGSGEDSHAANTAARLHADVEIVETISKHMDIRLPLFLDGAERLNTLPAFDGQMIALQVSTAPTIQIINDKEDK